MTYIAKKNGKNDKKIILNNHFLKKISSFFLIYKISNLKNKLVWMNNV